MKERVSRLLAMVRFGWRLQRFELTAALLAGVVPALLAVIEIARLADVAPPTRCLLDLITAGVQLSPGCPPLEAWFLRSGDEAGKIEGLMIIVPVVIGLIPGSSLVAIEIEHRTAQLAWMLAPSRRQWLLERLIPVLVAVVIASTVVAIAGELLAGSRLPWVDPRSSFNDYGNRGPVLVMRAVAFASLGVLIGAIMGRQLPALLVGVMASITLLVVLSMARPFGEPLVPVNLFDPARSDLVVAERFQTADGSLLTMQDALGQGPPGMGRDETTEWLDSNFVRVQIGVPGERLGAVEFRESAVLLLFATAAVAATGLVIERRRPY